MPGRADLPAGLLEDIKNYLDITWDDEATDKKIGGLIASGMAYLDGKSGEAEDARDSALDVYENNYTSMILSMQNERAVARYVESAEQAEP